MNISAPIKSKVHCAIKMKQGGDKRFFYLTREVVQSLSQAESKVLIIYQTNVLE